MQTQRTALRHLWRSLAYLSIVTPVPLLGYLGCLLVPAIARSWTAAGLAAVMAVVAVAIAALAAPLERRAVTVLGRERLPPPAGYEPTARRAILFALVSYAIAPLSLAATAFGFGFTWIHLVSVLRGPTSVAVGDTVLTATEGGAAGLLAALFIVPFAGSMIVGLAHLRGWSAAKLLDRRAVDPTLIESDRTRTELIRSFDNERVRLERDLHDGPQQQVVALAMLVDNALIDLEEGRDDEARVRLENAKLQVGDLLGELRALSQGVLPPSLAELGLASALTRLADRSALPVELRRKDDRRLPPEIERTLYFVGAEALANAARHSGASRATMELMIGDDATLTIADDGCGGADPTTGTGLTGLSQRAAAAGGRLSIDSPPGGPTVLVAKLPITASHGP